MGTVPRWGGSTSRPRLRPLPGRAQALSNRINPGNWQGKSATPVRQNQIRIRWHKVALCLNWSAWPELLADLGHPSAGQALEARIDVLGADTSPSIGPPCE